MSKQNDTSYTAAAGHMTAAQVGKVYEHEFSASDDPDKSPARTSDGYFTSHSYLRGALGNAGADSTSDALKLSFHHPAENWLRKKWVRRILAMISRPDEKGHTTLERILRTYRDPTAPAWQKIKYMPVHSP